MLREKHLGYFLNIVGTTEPHLIRPEQLEWLAQLDADYVNIRSALAWALTQESAEHSLQFCAALGWYWGIRDIWREGTRWLGQALAKPARESAGEITARVKALYQDAALANHLDDLVRMKSSAEESLALAQKVSYRRELAIARFYLGWALDRQNDYEHAIPLMQQSLQEFQEMHEIYWESVAFRWLGHLLVRRGQLTLKQKIQNHLKLARRAGEKKNLGDALLNYAWLLYQKNDIESAEKNALEAHVQKRFYWWQFSPVRMWH